MSTGLSTRIQRKQQGRLTVKEAPAPWNLHVKQSFVFPFLVNSSKTKKLLAKVNDPLRSIDHGLGVAMIVQYADSPVGAYDELLYGIPAGVSKDEILPFNRIPVIYVSTEDSLRNGRKNWGIRKELADFDWKITAGYIYTDTTVKITDHFTKELILQASFRSFNFPLPIHLGIVGKLIPAIVERNIDEEGEIIGTNEYLKIRPSGFGWSRICMLTSCMEGSCDLKSLGIIAGIQIKGVLNFPKPAAMKINNSE